MPKKKMSEDGEDPRPRRPQGGMGGGPSGGGGGGGGGGPAGEYDADEVARMVEQARRTGTVANQNHFSSRRAWQEYLHALPQEIKAGWKGERGAKDRELEKMARSGRYSFADTGIKNVKEEGQARFRRMGMHNLDKSYTYDWEKGVKYNVATSDDNEYMRPVPITDDDRREYAEIQKYGATPEGFWRRQQDAQLNQMNTWAAQNAVKGGTLRKDEHGLYMMGDQGQRIDFDPYGNLIDANTGQLIGDNQYGFGTDLQAAAGGYKSPWSIPGSNTAPAGPTQPIVPITPPPMGGISPVGPYGGGGGLPPGGTGGGVGGGPPVLHAPPTSPSTMRRPPAPTAPASGGMGFAAPGRQQVAGMPPTPTSGTGNAWGARTNAYTGGGVQRGPGTWYRKPAGGMGTGPQQPRPQYY